MKEIEQPGSRSFVAGGIPPPAESLDPLHDDALVHDHIDLNHHVIESNSNSNDFNITDLDFTLIYTTLFDFDQASLPTQLTITNCSYRVIYWWHPLHQTPLKCGGMSVISPLMSQVWSSLLATHLMRPVNQSNYPNIHVSFIGIIPTHPCFSVNDANDSKVYSMKYPTVDDAARFLERGTCM